jgi:hypothetical protein
VISAGGEVTTGTLKGPPQIVIVARSEALLLPMVE